MLCAERNAICSVEKGRRSIDVISLKKQESLVRVAAGEAEIGSTFLSEIVPMKAVKAVGPLPQPIQNATAYAAGIMTASSNREARLFDEVLSCLSSRYGVDENHVHSVGFSLGAILTDMLGVIRGDRLASTLTFSGGYFSNPANVSTLGIGAALVTWPEMTTTNRFAQVLLHGNTTDTYDLAGYVTVHFDTFAANDVPYLNALGHDVVLCDHGEGHEIPDGFGAARIVEFFQAHAKGASAWTAGLPADYVSLGYCTFHPHQ